MPTKIQERAVQTAQPTQQSPKQKMTNLIKAMEPEIKKALPSVITPDRFTRMVLSAMSTTKQLAECTSESFLGAMMNAAQLGLEPNTPLGQAYIIPYKDHGVLKAQFQLGYMGLINLCHRSEEVTVIQAHVVYSNDEFEYEYGLNPKLIHKPALTDRGEPVMVYALFKTKSGGYGFQVQSVDEIRRHAEKYSKSYNSAYSPWNTNFEEMAKKTVLKAVLKYAPLKSEFVRGVSQDETIKSAISEDMYSVTDETIYDATYEEVNDSVDAPQTDDER